MTRRRVALYGGAFDPPHRAHVAVARASVQRLGLDELRVVPTGRPGHRSASSTSGAHRVAMARLAFAGLPQAVVDSWEVDRPQTSYTVDTLQTLCDRWGDAEVFLIMGQDQWSVFDTWSQWSRIAKMAQPVVFGRPKQDAVADASVASEMTDESLSLGSFQPAIAATAERLGLPVVCLDVPPDATSATQLRQQLLTRQPHQSAAFLTQHGLLDEAVAQYIDNHQLYR